MKIQRLGEFTGNYAAGVSCAAAMGAAPSLHGPGFPQAVAELASGMKMHLWSAHGAPVEGRVANIPIRLDLQTGGETLSMSAEDNR